MVNLNFIENRESIEPASNTWELIPEGIYQAAINSAELMSTKKGDGQYLKVEHQIFEEGSSFDGRTIFTNFNVANPNEKALQIGLGQLSALSKACGLASIPEDSNDLLEKFHYIKVKQVPGSGINQKTGEPYGPKNEIKAFYKDKPVDAKKVAKAEIATAAAKFDGDALPDFGFVPVDNK